MGVLVDVGSTTNVPVGVGSGVSVGVDKGVGVDDGVGVNTISATAVGAVTEFADDCHSLRLKYPAVTTIPKQIRPINPIAKMINNLLDWFDEFVLIVLYLLSIFYYNNHNYILSCGQVF